MVAWASSSDRDDYDRGASVQILCAIDGYLDEPAQDSCIAAIHRELDHQSIKTETGGRQAAVQKIIDTVRAKCANVITVTVRLNDRVEFVD